MCLFFVAGCQTKNVAKSADDIAKQKLGANVDQWPNEAKTLILYLEKNDNPSRVTRGLVVDVKKKKIIYQFTFVPGYAKWVDDLNLEIFSAPEVMKEGDDMSNHIKRINLKGSKYQPK